MMDRIRKWLTRREIKGLEAGEVPGMAVLDVRAALEGQAEDLMRGYAQKSAWWKLEEREEP